MAYQILHLHLDEQPIDFISNSSSNVNNFLVRRIIHLLFNEKQMFYVESFSCIRTINVHQIASFTINSFVIYWRLIGTQLENANTDPI